MRPACSWPQALLLLLLALCPALTAAGSRLELPIGLFAGAGAGAWLAVIWFGAPRRPLARRIAWLALAGLALAGCGLILLAVTSALPPPALVSADLAAAFARLAALLRDEPAAALPPADRTLHFLVNAMPRAAAELQAAPTAGTSGARLIIGAGGALLTWLGTLALVRALIHHRSVLGWSTPLLLALALTTILGGGNGAALAIGLGLALLLALVGDFQRREQGWERARVPFSDELLFDVVLWGSLLIGLALALAWLLPLPRDTPLARAVWSRFEPPSGIAAIEQQVRGAPTPVPGPLAVGVAAVPDLPLGRSLAQGPLDQPALQVQVIPAQPPVAPLYWRTRVYDQYNGRAWNARLRRQPWSAPLPEPALPGLVSQQVTDRRPDRRDLAALPAVVAVDHQVTAGYLPTGDLSALLRADPPRSYTVWSQPAPAAALPGPDTPDLRAYLELPPNLAPRVRELAAAVGGATTPREQALNLERYLRGLPYAYTVDPLPVRGEAVEQFLFEMRRGYCTYYASAMAVMARSLGIPARLAIGYATGVAGQTPGSYTVYERHAHAWPELLIDGRWTAFEPTPIYAPPVRAAAGSPPATPLPTPAPVTPPAAGSRLIWVGATAALAFLVGLALLWWRMRLTALAPDRRAQLQLEAAGRRLGLDWPPGATLHEYAALLATHLPGESAALNQLATLLATARYSGQPLAPDDEQTLAQAGARLVASARHMPEERDGRS